MGEILRVLIGFWVVNGELDFFLFANLRFLCVEFNWFLRNMMDFKFWKLIFSVICLTMWLGCECLLIDSPVFIVACVNWKKLNKRDNYNKPTCGMARFHFAYLCFNHLHFAHLNFNPLPIRYLTHHQTLEKHIFIQNQNITQIKNTNPLFFSLWAIETRKSL